MAKTSAESGRELEIVNAIIARFGGQRIENKALKDWLSSQYPDIWACPDSAKNFVERIGIADFASAHRRAADGTLVLRGWGAILGKRGVANDHTPKAVADRQRWWAIPSKAYEALPTKAAVFAALGVVVPTALPTHSRATGTWRQHLAANKAGE